MLKQPLHSRGLRAVALFEAMKGGVVLGVGFGLLTFLGRNAEDFAARLVHRTHLNPAHHYPKIFIEAMAKLDDVHLWLLAGFAAVYAAVRLIEGYGLWYGRKWAEWMAAASGGLYVPVEVYELVHQPTAIKGAALVLNLAVVVYMLRVLNESRRQRVETTRPVTTPP